MLPYDSRLKAHSRNLRSNMTDAEQKLWQRLRSKQINGWQFYRQKPLGSYIVDFYCPAACLVIELDGSQHFELEHQLADQQRDAYLAGLGLRVLRFDNRQVLLETDAVVEVISKIPPNPPFSKGGAVTTPVNQASSLTTGKATETRLNAAHPMETGKASNTPQKPINPMETGKASNTPQKPVHPMETGKASNTPQKPVHPMETGKASNTPQKLVLPMETAPPPNTLPKPVHPMETGKASNTPQKPVHSMEMGKASGTPPEPVPPFEKGGLGGIYTNGDNTEVQS